MSIDLVNSTFQSSRQRKQAELYRNIQLLDLALDNTGFKKLAVALSQCRTVQDFQQFLNAHLHRSSASGHKLRLNLVSSNPQFAFDIIEALLLLNEKPVWSKFSNDPAQLRGIFAQAKNQDPSSTILLGVGLDLGPPPQQQIPGYPTGSPIPGEALMGFVEGEVAPGHAMILVTHRQVNGTEFRNVLGHSPWTENFDRLQAEKLLVNPVKELNINRATEPGLAARLDKYSTYRKITNSIASEYRQATGQSMSAADLPSILGVGSEAEAKDLLYELSDEAVRLLITGDLDTYDLDHRVQQAVAESMQSGTFVLTEWRRQIKTQADAKIKALGSFENDDKQLESAFDAKQSIPKPNIPDDYLNAGHGLGFLADAVGQSTGVTEAADAFSDDLAPVKQETAEPNGVYILRGAQGSDADFAAEFLYHNVVDPERWRILQFEPNSVQSKFVGEPTQRLAATLRAFSQLRHTIIDIANLGDYLREIQEDSANPSLGPMNEGLQAQFAVWIARGKNNGLFKERGIIVLIHDSSGALAQRIEMAASGAGATVPFGFPGPEEFGVRLQNSRATLPEEQQDKAKYRFAEQVLGLFDPKAVALDMIEAESQKFESLSKTLAVGKSTSEQMLRSIPRFRPGNLSAVFVDFTNRLNLAVKNDQNFAELVKSNGVDLANWSPEQKTQLLHVTAPLLHQAIHAANLQYVDVESSKRIAPGRDEWIQEQYKQIPKGLSPYRDPSGAFVHRHPADELAHQQHLRSQWGPQTQLLSEHTRSLPASQLTTGAVVQLPSGIGEVIQATTLSNGQVELSYEDASGVERTTILAADEIVQPIDPQTLAWETRQQRDRATIKTQEQHQHPRELPMGHKPPQGPKRAHVNYATNHRVRL